MNVYTWDSIKRKDYYVDYQNLYTFLGVFPQRELFAKVSDALIMAGEFEKAEKVLDKCMECVPEDVLPLESICLGFTMNDLQVVNIISQYYLLGAPDKARRLGANLSEALLHTIGFYIEYSGVAIRELQLSIDVAERLADTFMAGGDKEMAEKLTKTINAMLSIAFGKEEDSVKENS